MKTSFNGRANHKGQFNSSPATGIENSDGLLSPGGILATRDKTLLVCPLGGVADIGMNWTLYGYNGKFILVDAGSAFAPREMDTVQAIFPDPRFLRSLGDRLVGLVLTHFHEDHVGAIHRIWPAYAKCPIHAPPFASRMLAERLGEVNTLGDVDIRTFLPGRGLSVGPFQIQSLAVAHSTPDSVSLLIKTPAGSALHTGDWKIDPKPGIGNVTNLDLFREAAGPNGVDLLLCDSTNAERERPQTSEASVVEAMTRVFQRAKGLVVVCSFGSNISRMATVALAAQATRRRVGLAGFSLRRAAQVAAELNMFSRIPKFIDNPRDLKRHARNQQVLLCTGTQGEANAALTRIAERTNENLPKIGPGDIVIHSARAIPGNEVYIKSVLALLKSQGAEIVTTAEPVEGFPVHVTGHPCREDLRQMYAAVRPKSAIPVHGSPMHLAAHAELARSLGVTDVTIPVNGGVYHMRDGQVEHGGHLSVPLVAVIGLQGEREEMVGWSLAEKRPLLDGERLPVSRGVAAARQNRKPAPQPAGDARADQRANPNHGRRGGGENGARQKKGAPHRPDARDVQINAPRADGRPRPSHAPVKAPHGAAKANSRPPAVHPAAAERVAGGGRSFFVELRNHPAARPAARIEAAAAELEMDAPSMGM